MEVTISVLLDVTQCSMLLKYPSTRRHIIEVRNFTTHSREKLRFLIKDVCFVILQIFLSNTTAGDVKEYTIGTFLTISAKI
jgi:hypothetical protein